RLLSALGITAARPELPLLLSASGDLAEPGAALRLAAMAAAGLGAVDVYCGRGRRLCRNAADLGRVRRHLDGDVQPPDAVPGLDLNGAAIGCGLMVRDALRAPHHEDWRSCREKTLILRSPPQAGVSKDGHGRFCEAWLL